MDAVILFSHGSLLCGSGEALDAHAARLRARGFASIVEVGYLNYTDPSFMEAATRCVAAGADRIVVTPYFLAPGYFVNVQMRKCMERAREAFPDVLFLAAEPLGYDESLADAVLTSARSARPESEWRRELRRAGESCRGIQECPLYNTADCPLSVEHRPEGAPL